MKLDSCYITLEDNDSNLEYMIALISLLFRHWGIEYSVSPSKLKCSGYETKLREIPLHTRACARIYIYIYIYRNKTDFYNKNEFIFSCKKNGSRSCNFCICIFAFINQSVLKFRDSPQSTIYDLLPKIWRFKTLNNFRNIFPLEIWKNTIF